MTKDDIVYLNHIMDSISKIEDFTEDLDTWLKEADLSDKKEQNIKEIMDLVRAHKTD